MTVAVIVPLSTALDEHRERAWQWIRSRYQEEHPDWEIAAGYCTGPWIKARAVDDALRRTDADVLVVADADCWIDSLADPVAQVAGGRLECVFPHGRVIRLNEHATTQVYTDGLPDTWPPRSDLEQADYDGKVGGGIVILTRDLYERAPLDPRFIGWGREDEAWGRALLTTTRQRAHGDLPLWHLWHPPQQRRNRMQGSEANEQLWFRYRDAAGDNDAMSLLIEEVRCHSRTFSPAP